MPPVVKLETKVCHDDVILKSSMLCCSGPWSMGCPPLMPWLVCQCQHLSSSSPWTGMSSKPHLKLLTEVCVQYLLCLCPPAYRYEYPFLLWVAIAVTWCTLVCCRWATPNHHKGLYSTPWQQGRLRLVALQYATPHFYSAAPDWWILDTYQESTMLN